MEIVIVVFYWVATAIGLILAVWAVFSLLKEFGYFEKDNIHKKIIIKEIKYGKKRRKAKVFRPQKVETKRKQKV